MQPRLSTWLVLALLALTLAACDRPTIEPTQTATAPALATAVPLPEATDPVPPIPSPTPAGQLLPTATVATGYPGAAPLPEPTLPAGYPVETLASPYPGDAAAPEPAGGSNSAGLLLRDDSALRLVLANGQTQELLSLVGYPYQTPPLPSPDLMQIATVENGDIVIIDRASGARRNVTNTADREECCLFGWLDNTQIVIGSRTPDQVGANLGAPALLALPDESVTLLDEALLTAPPALSVDGTRIAWGSAAGPRLYTLGSGTETLDVAAYANAPAIDAGMLRVPAFAPSGDTIAWYGPSASDPATLALYLVNLDTRSVETVDGLGSSSVVSMTPPAWYTTGEWLAFESYQAGEAQPEIIVYYPASGEQRQLGDGIHPGVSPGGGVLVYQLGTLLLQVDTESWQAERLPFGGTPLGWRLLPIE